MSKETINNFQKSVYWPYNNIFNSNYSTKFTQFNNNCNIVIRIYHTKDLQMSGDLLYIKVYVKILLTLLYFKIARRKSVIAKETKPWTAQPRI